MSNIGKKLIKCPQNVDLCINDRAVQIKGPLGSRLVLLPYGLDLIRENQKKLVYRLSLLLQDSSQKRFLKHQKQSWGLWRTLLNQKIRGVSFGFSCTLFFVGIGYYVEILSSFQLSLKLGYADKIIINIPENLKAYSPKRNIIIISGTDLQKVSLFTAKIRSFRLPNIYKRKGVLYKGETLQLKEVKKK